MKYLLIILFFFFALGQLGRMEIFSSELVIHLNDVAVLLVVGFLALKQPKKLKAELLNNPLAKPLGFWTLVMVASLVLNVFNFAPRELAIASLYGLRFVFYASLYFVLRANLTDKTEALVKRGLILAGVAVAGFGLVQYLFLPDVSFLYALEWDDHYYRLIGTYFDPGFTGAILGLSLFATFIWRKDKTDWAILAVIYTAFALTYSRASYILFQVGFTMIAWYRRSVKIFLAAGLILFLTIMFLPNNGLGEGTKLQRESSIWARVNNWKESVTIWQQSPIWGHGFNTYRYVRDESVESHAGAGADSSILLVLATTGLIGFGSFLWLLWTMWRQGRTNLVFAAGFAAVLVHSNFNNTLFYPWVLEWLFIVLALNVKETRENTLL